MENMEIEDCIVQSVEHVQNQKPTFYNQYLPFHETIHQRGLAWFEEIRENLSRSVQMGELRPGFAIWSYELHQYLSLYGFNFTKMDHLKLIQLYLSMLSMKDLNYSNVQICFDRLYDLLRKTNLITREELIIDWRILYHWGKLMFDNHDRTFGIAILPKDIKNSFFFCIFYCNPYFAVTATQDILDEINPKLCPMDWTFTSTIQLLQILLPVHLPPALHDQGFKLWLPQIFGIWDNVYNDTAWELHLTILFSCVTWYNIGYIDWEPRMPQIFTRILRGFALPSGKLQMAPQKYTYLMYSISRWIVGMIGNRSSCLQYLKDLLTAIKSFYHPSNTGDFQEKLVNFILNLSSCFVERVHLERKNPAVWYFIPHSSHRLTDEDITNFVHCIKEYAFMSIFNKDHAKDAAETCQHLSVLRPELIVPTIVEKLFISIDNASEPHRFTSILTCLTRVLRQVVRQTPTYAQGQTFILPLITAVLPGIDLNDFKKTLVTLEFLNTIFMMITCVDCSSAVRTRNDLTGVEKEVCLSTGNFADVISELLNRIFQIIKTLSTDISDASVATDHGSTDDDKLESKLASILLNIVKHSSNEISRMIREKVVGFLSNSCLPSKVKKLVAGLISAIIVRDPEQTLKSLLPRTCETINRMMDEFGYMASLTDHKGDKELHWTLILFSELLRARGDTLLVYKPMIVSIFHRCKHIIHKGSYQALAMAAEYLLKSLTHMYLIDSAPPTTSEMTNGSHEDVLPIRVWGQPIDAEQIQVHYHIPHEDELDFARDFVETFMYTELDLLLQSDAKFSNEERSRSLTMVHHLALGCFRVIPRIPSTTIKNLRPILVAHSSESRSHHSIHLKQPKFRENLRLRLLIDIGKLLDLLVTDHSNDVSSINIALDIYSGASIDFGVSKQDVDKLRKDIQSNKQMMKNRLCVGKQNPRSLVMKRIALQLQLVEMDEHATLTEIDKQVTLKLFELSINRYSETRRKAQMALFSVLHRYRFSGHIIIDRIIELLNGSNKDTDHDQIKGCLHVLLGNSSYFLPNDDSWPILLRLWPTLVCIKDTKLSTQNLIDLIQNKIHRLFVTKDIIQHANESVINAAADLWYPLKSNETNMCEAHNQTNMESYTQLMETLSSLLRPNTLAWKQQKMAISFITSLLQRQVPIPLSCIRICVDLLIHDHAELRKFALKCMAAIGRLQKPPRIQIEKSLDEILWMNKISSSDMSHAEISPGDRADNAWVTIDEFKPPTTQDEWEQMCFLDKTYHGFYTWPNTIKYTMNKRARHTRDEMPEHVAIIFDRFNDRSFLSKLIELMVSEQHTTEMSFSYIRSTVFKSLFRNFGIVFVGNMIEQVYGLIREKKQERQENSHRVASEIVAGMIAGSKHWTLQMLEELWEKLTPLLTEICLNLNTDTLPHWNSCFKCSMEHEDPRRMYRLIHFLHSLINNPITSNTFNEIARWSLVQNLRMFQWRIPSVWRSIHEQAQGLMNHSFKLVREHIATVLSQSLSFNIRLFNNEPTRHPDRNQCIDEICEKLRQAIAVYERTPLVNVYSPSIELDDNVSKSMNLIETVILLQQNLFTWCRQPIGDALLRMFPYLCEIESLTANDPVLKSSLSNSRMQIAMAYLNEQHLETLVEQLEQVSKSSKWHARQIVIEFIQSMVFCNLFNARPYANRLHQLVTTCLSDERLEVRTAASITLSGLYQCGYMQTINHDLKYFSLMAKTKYVTKTDDKKVKSMKHLVKRHGGILGLCAIVLSNPYEIPDYMPETLTVLCKYSHDPDPMQKSIKQCLSEFRRTHYDSWHEHQEKFTEYQLMSLADAFISRSYYA